MKLKLPPGYNVEMDADLLMLRRLDGSSVATFSARDVAMKLVEKAAWEDYGDSPPSPGGERAKSRSRGNFLAALFYPLALILTIRAGLKGFGGGSAPTARHALY
jgi:hypothetical protein